MTTRGSTRSTTTRQWSTDPHHDGSTLYRPDGLDPDLGDQVRLRVRVPHTSDGTPGAESVVLRQVWDGEPRFTPAEVEATDAHGAWWSVPLTVRNRLTSYRFLVAGAGGSPYRWLTAAGTHARDVTDAGDFKLSVDARLPAWVPDQVGYQVFPDRFERTETGQPLPSWATPARWDDPVVHEGPETGTQLYGGTLDGVARRLDHLVDLGVGLLYLTPMFEAWSNHRYDAVSFDRVDPVLGGDDGLRRLLTAAHRRGLRVVGDLTTNHTGSHHDWFLRALDDPGSVERGFYRFHDGPGGYESWLDFPSLPKLDHRSAELARRLYDGPTSVVAAWLAEGLDGWRIDVANMTGRMGPDDRALEVAATLRRTMAEVDPERWLLAEHNHDASLDLTGPGWHGTMDYAGFTRPVWAWLNGGSATQPADPPGLPHDLGFLGLPVPMPVLPATAAVATMREVHAAMPWSAALGSTLHLDTHDSPRFRTVVGGGTSGWIDAAGVGRGRHLAGLALQMTLPGVPVVFAGDEIGLTGVSGEHARTPYPWSRSSEWDAETLAAYRTWIALRTDHVALRRGGLRWLAASADTVVFLREHPEQTLLVAVTRRPTEPLAVPLPGVGGLTPLVGCAPAYADGRLTVSGDGPAASVCVVG